MTRSSPAPREDDADSGRLRALLERAATGRDGQAWSDLWTELYHNGSLDAADPLVLHTPAGMAEADTAASALHLAGAVLVQADQRHETRNLRHRYAPQIARLLGAANRWRQITADRDDYCHLLEAVLNLEGDIHWAEDLLWGVVSEEYELECPDPDGCASLWVVLGERGFFSAAQDYALSDDIETLPLHPADPRALEGLGRRLHDVALADGHEEVAHALTYTFGEWQPWMSEAFRAVALAGVRPVKAVPAATRLGETLPGPGAGDCVHHGAIEAKSCRLGAGFAICSHPWQVDRGGPSTNCAPRLSRRLVSAAARGPDKHCRHSAGDPELSRRLACTARTRTVVTASTRFNVSAAMTMAKGAPAMCGTLETIMPRPISRGIHIE